MWDPVSIDNIDIGYFCLHTNCTVVVYPISMIDNETGFDISMCVSSV